MKAWLRRLIALKAQARKSYAYRGHEWSAWRDHERGAFTVCPNCGKRVDVIVNPRPNEIDIGGEAVALSCED